MQLIDKDKCLEQIMDIIQKLKFQRNYRYVRFTNNRKRWTLSNHNLPNTKERRYFRISDVQTATKKDLT
jgi:hypothetical protein